MYKQVSVALVQRKYRRLHSFAYKLVMLLNCRGKGLLPCWVILQEGMLQERKKMLGKWKQSGPMGSLQRCHAQGTLSLLDTKSRSSALISTNKAGWHGKPPDQ
jgi:hypothetical protein